LGIDVVSVSAHVLADISDTILDGSIEVEEWDLKTFGQTNADAALARTARANQSNRR